MASVESIAAWNETLTGELNTLWLLLGAILVFFMQTGFAMLEVGNVDAKNTRNILLKNVLDASLGAIIWWTVGYGFAVGKSPSGFFGTDSFFLDKGSFKGDGDGYLYGSWLFQWAFAATAATICSGAVAERCTLTAYLVYATSLIGVIYPVVVQVAWGGDGYMSKFLGSDAKADYFQGCGVLDFAGSGVVHMTGGCAALVGALVIGPRKSFRDGNVQVPTYGPVFQTLGTLILWFGWYGFNGMSTLAIVGYGHVAAKTMVTTTISAACGAVGTLALGSTLESLAAKATGGKAAVKLEYANNGVLAGLVAITAGCSVVEPYAAAIIGLGAAVVYYFTSKFLKKCGVDDVVDAAPVHFFCGAYGVFMASLFATQENYAAAYGASYDGQDETCAGLFYGGDGSQFTANMAFVVFVTAWVGATTLVLFVLLRLLGVLRVTESVEEEGMDSSEHGAPKRGDEAGL